MGQSDDDEGEHGWLEALHRWAQPGQFDLLAASSECSTCVWRQRDRLSILKIARPGGSKIEDLRAQWQVLSLLASDPDFPGPTPLAWHVLPEGCAAIELTHLPGQHPDFEDLAAFRTFGATIARLHRITRGRRLSTVPVWNLDRVARHFTDPRLIRLFTTNEMRLVHRILARFGPCLTALEATGDWTGLVHSDCHRHNTLIEGACGRLIDFGECGWGVLFWDLGVAIADSTVDAPDLAADCRAALIEGYLSVLPDAAPVLETDLAAFEALRSLEVMTWPVSDWTADRLADGEEEARNNIEASLAHLDTLLTG